jgi:hypothetical protein
MAFPFKSTAERFWPEKMGRQRSIMNDIAVQKFSRL